MLGAFIFVWPKIYETSVTCGTFLGAHVLRRMLVCFFVRCCDNYIKLDDELMKLIFAIESQAADAEEGGRQRSFQSRQLTAGL